jgi:hypothetical protein
MKLVVQVLSILAVLSAPAAAQTRDASRVGLALVIGNSSYAQAELPTVETDRSTMAAALRSLGFKVHEAMNLARPRDFEEELRTFLRDENAAPEDTLVVYYSGHGLQIEGRPYLLGTGITSSADVSTSLRDYAEDVNRLIAIMEQAAPSARVLIVDACRNNAFATTVRKAGPSFQRAIEDTYLLFADEPGKTVPARSDTTVQSPFTAGLLYALENSATGLEERFRLAAQKTRELNPEQNPQMIKSDTSVNRNRPFLDHDARSAPVRSAVLLLEEAEAFYRTASWTAFRDKVTAARILSSEPELTTRLEHELEFCKQVLAASAIESVRVPPRGKTRRWHGNVPASSSRREHGYWKRRPPPGSSLTMCARLWRCSRGCGSIPRVLCRSELRRCWPCSWPAIQR